MIYSVRAISCLSVLVLAIFKGTLGSQGLSAEQMEDLTRGPEYSVALLDKQRRTGSLSQSDLIFAGFETIRGLHLSFEFYKKMLNDHSAFMAMMALMTGASAEAPTEYATLIQPLVESTQSLLVSTLDKYPVVHEPADPAVAELVRAKMLSMADQDISFIQTLFAPGTVTSLLGYFSDRRVQIGMATLYGQLLMQIAMMTDSLTCLTRDADRIVPMQNAVIAVATAVKSEVQEALGSDESTKMAEQGFDNAINGCTEYKKILENYKETGVWSKGQHGPQGPSQFL